MTYQKQKMNKWCCFRQKLCVKVRYCVSFLNNPNSSRQGASRRCYANELPFRAGKFGCLLAWSSFALTALVLKLRGGWRTQGTASVVVYSSSGRHKGFRADRSVLSTACRPLLIETETESAWDAEVNDCVFVNLC